MNIPMVVGVKSSRSGLNSLNVYYHCLLYYSKILQYYSNCSTTVTVVSDPLYTNVRKMGKNTIFFGLEHLFPDIFIVKLYILKESSGLPEDIFLGKESNP